MKGVKERILRRLRSIPQLGTDLKQAPRVLRTHAADGLRSPPASLATPRLHLEAPPRPSSPGRALREIPVGWEQQEAQQEQRCGPSPKAVLCKTPEPDIIDVGELMRDLEDEDEDEDGLEELSDKENIRPAAPTPPGKGRRPSSPFSGNRGPCSWCPLSTAENLDGSLQFRRPDPNSDSLFDPDLLAAFEQAVMDHIRYYEDMRCKSWPSTVEQELEEEEREERKKEEEGDEKMDQGQPPCKVPRTQAADDEGDPLRGFKLRCPPGGRDAVVLYTTTLRGIRKTFEDCSSVRFLLSSLRVRFCERDVSMHLGYREELWEVLGGRAIPPQLFVRGRYVGGADEVLGLHERGQLLPLLRGLPTYPCGGATCGGCGGVGFVVCTECSGGRKVVEEEGRGEPSRCPRCNENGLVVCTVCSSWPCSPPTSCSSAG